MKYCKDIFNVNTDYWLRSEDKISKRSNIVDIPKVSFVVSEDIYEKEAEIFNLFISDYAGIVIGFEI